MAGGAAVVTAVEGALEGCGGVLAGLVAGTGGGVADAAGGLSCHEGSTP
ncbi:hypothetical protein BN2537_5491 [Streptomyces venezuelae]|nr:hypothetical protein BN2537_5491 [Streptomyces venezuelae]